MVAWNFVYRIFREEDKTSTWIKVVNKIKTIIGTLIETVIPLTSIEEFSATRCHSTQCDMVYIVYIYLEVETQYLFRKQWDTLNIWWDRLLYIECLKNKTKHQHKYILTTIILLLATVKQVCSEGFNLMLIHHWNPTRQSCSKHGLLSYLNYILL